MGEQVLTRFSKPQLNGMQVTTLSTNSKEISSYPMPHLSLSQRMFTDHLLDSLVDYMNKVLLLSC
jgi:hypothetical protein